MSVSLDRERPRWLLPLPARARRSSVASSHHPPIDESLSLVPDLPGNYQIVFQSGRRVFRPPWPDSDRPCGDIGLRLFCSPSLVRRGMGRNMLESQGLRGGCVSRCRR